MKHVIRHLFLNMPARAGRGAIERTLAQYAPRHDVLAFAEGGHLLRNDHLIAPALDGFGVVEAYPGTPTPITYRLDLFDLLGVSWRHVSEPRPDIKRGKGRIYEKRLSTAILGHKPSGLVWSFSAFHAVASIQFEERDELHEEQVREVAQIVEAQVADVSVVSADWNTTATNPNMRPLHRYGLDLDSNPTKGTHGRRAIDLTYRHGAPEGLTVGRQVLPGPLADDHDGQRTVWRWPA